MQQEFPNISEDQHMQFVDESNNFQPQPQQQ